MSPTIAARIFLVVFLHKLPLLLILLVVPVRVGFSQELSLAAQERLQAVYAEILRITSWYELSADKWDDAQFSWLFEIKNQTKTQIQKGAEEMGISLRADTQINLLIAIVLPEHRETMIRQAIREEEGILSLMAPDISDSALMARLQEFGRRSLYILHQMAATSLPSQGPAATDGHYSE